MPIEAVDSSDDPRVAIYRDVKDADLRASAGLFMAEGRLGVRRLVESRRFRTHSVLCTPTAFESLRDAFAARVDETTVYIAPQRVLNAVVGYDLHRGCLAAGLRSEPGADPAALACVLAAPGRPSTVVALEQLTNPDNVGSAFRNARAFGADGVLLCPRCCDPLYRKALRVSMGASLSLPFARCTSWPGDLERARAAGYRIVALDPGNTGGAVPISTVASEGRVLLVVGTEGPGLSDGARAAADVRARIPMAPGIDSLNAATALGIALHHFARGTR